MKRLLMVIALVSILSATALAGDMPGVNPGSPRSYIPTVGSTPKPGDMPGVDSATAEDADSSAVMTVLLTVITFIAR